MKPETVKSLMKQGEITQKELAKMTSISESTLSRILAGKQEPRLDDALKIASALSVSVERICGVEEAHEKDLLELMERAEKAEAMLEIRTGNVAYLKRIIRVIGTAFFVLLAIDVVEKFV